MTRRYVNPLYLHGTGMTISSDLRLETHSAQNNTNAIYVVGSDSDK